MNNKAKAANDCKMKEDKCFFTAAQCRNLAYAMEKQMCIRKVTT
jgi:hypothetical protein